MVLRVPLTDRSVLPGKKPAPGLAGRIAPTPDVIPEPIEFTPEPTPDVIEPTPETVEPTPEPIAPTSEPTEPMTPFKGAVRPRRCACAAGVPSAASSTAVAAKKRAK